MFSLWGYVPAHIIEPTNTHTETPTQSDNSTKQILGVGAHGAKGSETKSSETLTKDLNNST